MSEERLHIELTANNKKLVSALDQSEVVVDKFAQSAKKAGTAVDNAGKAAGKSSVKWMEAGRIAQDAAFGFNAIANNITQLIPAAGAMGFAFSVLIGSLSFAQTGLSNWTRKSKEARDETEKFNKELAQETVSFQTLYRTATNANIPLEARKHAVKELRDNYGNYLKDFSDEAIMAGKATSAYNSLTDAIVRNAKAKAAQNKITELAAKQLELEGKMADIAAKAQKTAADNEAKRKQRGDVGLRQQEMTGGIQSATTTFNEAAIAMQKVVKEYEAINQQIKMLEGTIDQNAIKPFTNDIKEATYASTELENILKKVNNTIVAGKRVGVNETITPETKKDAQPKPFGGFITADQIPLMQEALKNQEQYLQNIEIATGLANTLGNSFANAMAQGQNLGEVLGNVFTDLAKQIGAALIKAALFAGIMSILPGAGAAAGIGGAAGGGFFDMFKNFLGLKFASGGTATGPKSGYPVTLHGTESIFRPDQLGSLISKTMQLGAMQNGSASMGDMQLQSKVSGQDLLLWIQRANYSTNLRR